MQMDFIVVAGANLQRILEHVERDVIAEVSIEIIVIRVCRLSGLENDLEVTIARAIQLALTGPPNKRLLIKRPGGPPIHRVPPQPKEMCQRLVRFGPYGIAFVLLVIRTNQ